MPRLNFYDTDAVKAFVLNILVENQELRQSLEIERRSSSDYFSKYQAMKERAEAAESTTAALKLTIADLKGEAYLAEKHLQEGGDAE